MLCGIEWAILLFTGQTNLIELSEQNTATERVDRNKMPWKEKNYLRWGRGCAAVER